MLLAAYELIVFFLAGKAERRDVAVQKKLTKEVSSGAEFKGVPTYCASFDSKRTIWDGMVYTFAHSAA